MANQTSGVCIVAAEFNTEVINDMIAAARAEADLLKLEVKRVVKVPGCYELPLIADLELSDDDVNGLVVLGYIERGETLHGEVMGHVVHHSLVQSGLRSKKPIGIGIIGPGATVEQAMARKGDYAKAAVRAMWRSLEILLKREKRSEDGRR
jgi:6,7-dimethyl-8-ribityllumazine synthase